MLAAKLQMIVMNLFKKDQCSCILNVFVKTYYRKDLLFARSTFHPWE